jgi:hypothetical protein
MTEAEWFASDDSFAMLDAISADSSDRKLRLLAVACCSHVREWMYGGKHSVTAVAVAERYADGLATSGELEVVRGRVREELDLHPGEPEYDPAFWACDPYIKDSIYRTMSYAISNALRRLHEDLCWSNLQIQDINRQERSFQACTFRDIIGNPFRPVAVDPSWLTSTVVALAGGIYEERAFDRLPILSDALQDAGCADPAVLNHCLAAGPHVRGCWVVDLLLGKA